MSGAGEELANRLGHVFATPALLDEGRFVFHVYLEEDK